MCGIAGIQEQDPRARPEPEVLRAMTASLAHRGPDDDGFEWLGATALGFRRLAIIDLASGHQPMPNEDRQVWVVMNGEIYNHAPLRQELQARGHTFRSSCDAEVLVHGWEAWGEELPERLLGMFALAIHDRRDGTLFLARDRMGQKPLYYAETAGAFVFGSELRALRQHPAVSSRVDRRALWKYLAYEMVPSPLSILEGVFKLPAGHRLTVRGGRIHSRSSYHRLGYSPKHTLSASDAGATLWEHLTRSVESQLMADVPLGVFLSGGVDSSSIVAAVRAVDPGRPLHTFSIGMDDPSFDESAHAAEVARFFETDHHAHSFSAAELRDTTAELPRLLDEPLADASILPTFLLSRFARGAVTVALGGDGGDEVFAGYDTFRAHRVADWYGRLVPAPVERAVIAPLVGGLPVSTANMSFDFRARQFLRGARLPEPARTWGWMCSFLPGELGQVLTREALEGLRVDDQLFGEAFELDREAAAEHSIDRQIHVLLRTYLAEDILTKVDRASMAVSLEVRAPFLDHGLVDWANRLPPTLKFRDGRGKWILREVLRGRVPETVLKRPKQGFGIPLSRWLRGELHDWAVAALEALDDHLGHLVQARRARQLLERHRSGAADHRKQLWTLCCLGIWAKSLRSPATRSGSAS
jgi:asparagine synthase (glutamine-hydrolysing)